MPLRLLWQHTLLALLHIWTWQQVTGAYLSDSQKVTSVGQLYQVMYREMKDIRGCYKLLNSTGVIGCQGPEAEIEAPISHVNDLPDVMTASRVVVVPAAVLSSFLATWQQNTVMQDYVKGVLVDDSDLPVRYSDVPKFPMAAYAPYCQPSYVWNPAGSDVSRQFFPFPMYSLTDTLAKDARERAAYNAGRGFTGGLYNARMWLDMTARSPNSTHCIAADTCRPLGGYSVWAAMPPIPAGQNITKPVILVLAQVDGIDLFHDLIQGADAPLSALVTLLTTVYGLQQVNVSTTYSKQLVFVALTGEPWDYLGSRRFLWELARGSETVQGLQLSMIEEIIEIGPVGRALQPDSSTQLYLHYQWDTATFGDASQLVMGLKNAAADVASVKATVSDASASNPGIPPSSLMSFLRVNASIQGVILNEFDQAYTNPYYGSRFDNGSQINPKAILGSAALLTAALHTLAGGQAADLKVNITQLQAVVNTLVSCIVLPSPGMSCAAVTSLMTPGYTQIDGVRSYAASHYIGVLRVMHPDHQNPFLKADMYRFIWNYLAVGTSAGSPGDPCGVNSNKCPAGQVCVGWKRSDKDPALMGRCLNASVHYVPAVSTRLTCQNCDDLNMFKWFVTDTADAWNQQYSWPADPIWAESDWPQGVPFLQLNLNEPYSTDVAVLVAGIVLTLATVVASYMAKVAFEKHLKSS
eukprot:jgi/Chrzof1/2417/Cz11g14180.t1